MRRLILALCVCVFLVNLGPMDVSADGMILPETLSPDYLVVRFHHVSVIIEDNIAITRVKQEFYNPHEIPVNGSYVFPIPPNAVLSNFQVVLDGENQSVIHQDQTVTNTLLFNMIVDRQDASLLQYMNWESFSLDLSLPPGGSREMKLEYQEMLTPVGGMYHYRYILSTERYSSQPLEEASIQVDLTSSEGLSSIYSSSHNVSIDDQGEGKARITWEAEDIHPNEDFEFFFAPSEGGFGGGFLIGERGGIDHFLFMFAPDMASMEESQIPKDIVFVIDRSGSMADEKIVQAQDALSYILGRLAETDRFSIIGFNDEITLLSSRLKSVNDQNITVARGFVNWLDATGLTDIESALQAALEIMKQSEARPEASKMIVFLTDGNPTSGVQDNTSITRLVTEENTEVEARIHVFGVGYDVNTHLLDALANENGGSVTYIQPGEDLEEVLVNFYGRISRPVLTDIEIELEGASVRDLHPKSIPDMFQGSSLMLTGRFEADSPDVTLRVRGKVAGERHEFVYRYGLDQDVKSDFVPRLWATRQIGLLLDEVRVEGESDQRIKEIQDLGLSYGVVTPYTTNIISPQESGAASLANMTLYDDPLSLNQVSGSTTIQARVQNQYYQQTDQAFLAVGANVVNRGQNSLAQGADWNIDLSLLVGNEIQNVPITSEWLKENIAVDRYVKFGSVEYFELAQDPNARNFLQSGTDVIFDHGGEVISVDATNEITAESDDPGKPTFFETIWEMFLSWFGID